MTPFTFTAPIETERLRLRLFRPGDAPAVHAYQSREDVCQFLLYSPRTLEEVQTKLAEYAQRTQLVADQDFLQLAVEHRETQAVLGEMVFVLRSTVNQTAELGWVFHPDQHGNGYASEAARALLALGFETIGLHRIVAELAPQNTASVRLCARIGMREEAHFVRDILVDGQWEDTGVHAMLREEWNGARQQPLM